MSIDLKAILPSSTVMIVTVTATTTNGKELSPEKLSLVLEACDSAETLDKIKRTVRITFAMN
jgi:U4/U6 small nuclear ribonucleoprotein PRP31